MSVPFNAFKSKIASGGNSDGALCFSGSYEYVSVTAGATVDVDAGVIVGITLGIIVGVATESVLESGITVPHEMHGCEGFTIT